MHREIRLAAFDLDDTLLTTDKKVSPYTKRVLLQAADRGVILLPATGRPFTAVPDVVSQLPMVRYVLTSNGAAIWDKDDMRIIYRDEIPQETARRVMDIIKGKDMLAEFYSEGKSYACADGYEKALHAWERIPESFKTDLKKYRQPVTDLEGMVRSGRYPVEKFRLTFGDPALQSQVMEALLAMGDLKIVHGASYNIELNTPKGTKGHALAAFAKMQGLTMDQVMALGDSENDLTMLQAAGLGIAMANALPEVKALADRVTLSNDEDGVAAAIETYVLRTD